MHALQANTLGKSYDGHVVFCDLSFSLSAGVASLEGVNGCGKSTLLKVLCGAEALNSGEVLHRGVSLVEEGKEARRQIAYVPDKSPVYPFIRGAEFIRLVDDLKGDHSDAGYADELIGRFGLTEHADSRFQNMSLGTQRKFFLVAALMGRPKSLFMDEPTNGLDAASRQVLLQILREECEDCLVLFSSHDKAFIEEIGARRLRLADGQLHNGDDA